MQHVLRLAAHRQHLYVDAYVGWGPQLHLILRHSRSYTRVDSPLNEENNPASLQPFSNPGPENCCSSTQCWYSSQRLPVTHRQ